MPFGPYLAVNNGVLKNIDQNNICVSIVLKAKTEKKKIGWPPKKGIFEFWNKNCKKNVSSFFSFVLALKTIEAQMLFYQ